eukprot:CAMPEP_0117448274 /NCGR_PEP_ID=MMETSP0759-20121206/7315_1 /TAXON_ID=63605 /ORGANISM="Percolomonas cosmopolitus, Strain WS" /LENGTH=95 /DNA_ID=CAMNT_0005240653 /DNA_START=176 /DNA_END=463 /DNA_ORIENTATION=-
MSPNVAQLFIQEASIDLPREEQENANFQKWWKVPSVMSFDNIAVSKEVRPRSEENHDVARYLTCAACEKDIVGYVGKGGEGFVACEIVQYRDDSE